MGARKELGWDINGKEKPKVGQNGRGRERRGRAESVSVALSTLCLSVVGSQRQEWLLQDHHQP